jgi:DNA (cytosine-5)-methyltransferase 1
MGKQANVNVIHLDLFSGIGGFAKGIQEAGFKVVKHLFSEIDKHAIANYRYNFKEAEYVGSVTDVQFIIGRVEKARKQFPKARLVITFGSPCQDFSLAGKRRGLDGDRSSLIQDAIRLISSLKPDVYIWENVKGAFSSNNGADFWAIIQAFANVGGYTIEWQLLNTAWVLPQNRERIYLIGHLGDGSGGLVFPFREESFRTNEGAAKPANVRTLSAGGNSGGMHSSMTLIKQVGAINSSQDGKVFSTDGISQCLSAGHGNMPKIHVKSATNQGFETATEGDSINLSQPNSETRRGRVGKGKAQTLETSCNQAVLIAKPRRTEEAKALRSESMKNGKDYTPFQGKEIVFEESTVMNTLTRALQKDNLLKTEIESKIRRLTETECERLQGFPDNHTKYGIYDHTKPNEVKEISRTQRYKMCGNAVTVAIVKMIADRLIK